MRNLINLIEATNGRVPRMWISPTGSFIDIDETGNSHSYDVLVNPDAYGVPEHQVKIWRDNLNDPDEEFDFDAVIGYLHDRGWVRTTRDASHTEIAVSGANHRFVRKALSKVIQAGYYFNTVTIEVGSVASERYIVLQDDRAIQLYVKTGSIPRNAI